MPLFQEVNQLELNLAELDNELLFAGTPTPLNASIQGQYSTEIAALTGLAFAEINHPQEVERPAIKDLSIMAAKDPIVSQCLAFKALRCTSSFGEYSHPKKEIEAFVNSNLKTLSKSFKQTIFKIFSSVILHGVAVVEFTKSSKMRGYRGQWRIANLNVLNPDQIISFGKSSKSNGKIDWILYDNGSGKQVKIPYSKCLHIVNNSGATFDKTAVWGVGDGVAALPYYRLKRVVLTHLALRIKNDSEGLLWAKTPNNGTTTMVDTQGNVKKDSKGKPLQLTKQAALSHQLKDIQKRGFIVTDNDVELTRIQIQNTTDNHFKALEYIDRGIQSSFAIPSGIFDVNSGSGTTNLGNNGFGQNFKMTFDSTIFALTTTLKHEIIHKMIRGLLHDNFPSSWFSEDWGEFVFDVEEDQATVNGRLSTITSLIASGIIPADDVEVLSLIRKNLGLPSLDEDEKAKKEEDALKAEVQKELEKQSQVLSLQAQINQLQAPQMPPEGQAEQYPPQEGGQGG
jgi:hypothetical protein